MAKEKKERPQGLEAALKVANQKYGENTVSVYSDRPTLNIDSFSSGSLAVDKALGIGGYPRGRIIEIYGPESSGKCLTADTYINTEKGLQTVKEIFEANGLVPSCTTRTTEQVYKLVNRHGELEDTVAFTNNGRRPVTKIVTRLGAEITSTENHPHLVMSPTGSWVWKRTSAITEGDYLVTLRSCGYFGDEEVGADTAYLLGVLVADAYFGEYKVTVTNDDPDVIQVIESSLSPLFGKSYHKYTTGNTYSWHINSTELVPNFYKKFGLKSGLAKDKVFSAYMRSLKATELQELIRGYMDCESSINRVKKELEVASASKELLTQLRLILRQFGIISNVSEKVVKGYEDNEYYRLFICGSELDKYMEAIGTRSAKVRAVYTSITPRTMYRTNIDYIPNLKHLLRDLVDMTDSTGRHTGFASEAALGHHDVSYPALQRILSYPDWYPSHVLDRLKEIYEADYVYEQVISVQHEIAEVPTFDFAMSNTHSFIANSVVTHNTSLTLHAIAECQKAGGRCAFIDVEHALDIKYAAALGVDVDELILSQPDNAEQALDLVELLVNSGEISLVVVDSVAALVPKVEIDGEMGDSHMGLQARLMSQALRKLTGIVQKTNTTVFFINQIRSKIGVLYGSNETTSGGNALKFYASVRLDIRRTGALKEGDEAYGNATRIKVVKNKVAPPFREAEFAILYGKGIDKTGEILDGACALSLVDRAGAWYSYNGERIGQGRDKAIDYLKQHPEILNTLEANIRKEWFKE